MPLLEFFQGIYAFFVVAPHVAGARLFLIALGFAFTYLGYRKILEPILMVPMGIGMVGVNGGLMVYEAGHIGTLFLNPMISNLEELMQVLQIDFLQPIYTFAFSNGLIACLVFMGIGAMTEIGDCLAMSNYICLFPERLKFLSFGQV